MIGLSITGISGASASDRASYPGSVPSWANAANDEGAAPADTSVEGGIYLPLRDEAEAEALAAAASTPGSRGYRQTLTPQRWIATFSPPQATLNTVVAYLKVQRLTITTFACGHS